MKPSASYIIPGYNGIMELDLTNIDTCHHEEMINVHHKDIENYKKEQWLRPAKLRYENAVTRTIQLIENHQFTLAREAEERDELWIQQYNQYRKPKPNY
jgi:hypothetical protein